MAKDVIVVVQRDALPNTTESLDILLIATAGAYPVAVYRDIESVEAVFGEDGPCPNAKVVRKVKTLFNQGKTTLAESLVNKLKIVSFESPSITPAQAATFNISFEDGALSSIIAKDSSLYVKIGGDENVVVKITATSEVKNGTALATLFKNTSFSKNGRTYNATVNGPNITYTATVAGATEAITETVDIYTDRALTQKSVYEPIAVFTNGSDEISAIDNFIATVKKFQSDEDNDWYFFLSDRDEPEYVAALAKFAEASEPSEAELGVGVEDHRKFYMGQTSDKTFAVSASRAAVIYTDTLYLKEEPDASYTGNVAPLYPNSVTWKFKRPQNGNSTETKLISLPKLTDGERDQLIENHVNFLTEEYKRQYVKDGTCLDGEYIDVVLGGDWIAKRMRDLLYEILLTNANINYDDGGFGLISTAVLQALDEAVNLNIIARDPESRMGIYTVYIPRYVDSTDDQRLSRTMPDILWEALLSGSIHQVKTKGALRVSI